MRIELGVYATKDYKQAIVVLQQTGSKVSYYDILHYQSGVHSYKENQKGSSKEMDVSSFLDSSDKTRKWQLIGKIVRQGSYYHIV